MILIANPCRNAGSTPLNWRNAMKLRRATVFLVAGLAAACAQEAAEQATAEPAAEMSADETALEQLRADYVTHYNLHHAPMVAEMFTDSAYFLAADGSVQEGRAAVQASLEAAMAGLPTLSLTTGETLVL